MELRCGKDHKLLGKIYPDRLEIQCRDRYCKKINVFYFDKEIKIIKHLLVDSQEIEIKN